MNTRTSEQGQVLVLIILAIVVLFGFAALAVDGGQLYAERRRAQNAADAAAYAAAIAAATGNDFEQAALDQAEMNGFADIDPDLNPGQRVDVIVHNPPANGPYTTNDDYYQVVVRTDVTRIFSQLVYTGPQAVEVEAVTHIDGGSSVAGSNAIHATKTTGEAIKFHGRATINVNGGNIYGTGFIDNDGAPGILRMTHGGLISHSTISTVSNATYDFKRPNQPSQPFTPVTQPSCDGLDDKSFNKNDPVINLEPGIYSQKLSVNGGGTMNLAPGIYCLDNGIQFNGGKITGIDVLLVIRGGSVRLEGQTKVLLARANSIIDHDGNQFGGLLMYMPTTNNNVIHLSGGANALYAGTVYAPDGNTCEVEGNEGLSLIGNIICHYITVGGKSTITVQYDQGQNLQFSPELEMVE